MTLTITELVAAGLIAAVILSLILSIAACAMAAYGLLEGLSAKKSTHTIQFKPVESIEPLKKMMNPSREEFDFDMPLHRYSEDD